MNRTIKVDTKLFTSCDFLIREYLCLRVEDDIIEDAPNELWNYPVEITATFLKPNEVYDKKGDVFDTLRGIYNDRLTLSEVLEYNINEFESTIDCIDPRDRDIFEVQHKARISKVELEKHYLTTLAIHNFDDISELDRNELSIVLNAVVLPLEG
jgi:hypothetical protein